jgi:2-hydroxy-3-keto-5-methylthiopentenyl-1-phosphate phosphatase
MTGATADVKGRPGRGPVLVSDFDGTMTRNDFYKLGVERLLPPNTPDHWAAYREGTLTHFEALRSYFAAIQVGVDKGGIVRGYLQEGRTVGFAGDGFPDAEAARLVPARLRFARADLGAVLRSDALPFQEFATRSDIAGALVQGGT